MHRALPMALPALALTLALAGCGSSKNNSNNNKGLFTQVPATQAAPVAATTVAAPPAASATKAAGSTSGGAAPTVASTQVSSTTTGGRSTTTTTTTTTTGSSGANVSATSVSINSSSNSACSSNSSTTSGTKDANLQSQLAKVALTDKDLPGYTSLSGFLGGGESDLTYPNETASYGDFFIKGNLTSISSGNPLAGNAVVESLNGFKDSGAASSTLKDLKLQALKQECSPDTKVEAVSGAPKLGDETLAYKITSTDSATPYSGYLIVWRRGKVDVVIAMIGNPGPKTLDETSALAKKLDDKMKAGGL